MYSGAMSTLITTQGKVPHQLARQLRPGIKAASLHRQLGYHHQVPLRSSSRTL